MSQRTLKIGDLSLDPGQKGAGSLAVAPRGDGSAVRLPLLAALGAEPGPVLVVSGGVHGDEYEGPRAIQRFWRGLDPGRMRGSFIGVPVVNVPAYQAGSRRNPTDGVDMNRVFPGREKGTLSEMIAHRFFSEAVARADCYLDLHAGGTDFAMTPTVVYLDTGDEELRVRELALARVVGPATLWKGQGLWPAAHVAAVRQGIPAVLCEIGQEGRCAEAAVRLGETIIANALRHTGMVEGEPEPGGEKRVIQGTYLLSRCGGCFYPSAGLLERVREGQTVGQIEDLWGGTLETVAAPHDGLVVSTRTKPAIRPGEWTVFVGREVETVTD